MSTQNAMVPPPDGKPAMRSMVDSAARPTMPTMASVLNIHLGNLGSIRYQCPRAISPVTPPRARAAGIAGAHPPDNTWIAQSHSGKDLENPQQVAITGQPPRRPTGSVRMGPPRVLGKDTDNTSRGGD